MCPIFLRFNFVDMAYTEMAQNREKELQARQLAQLKVEKKEAELNLITKLQHRWENEVKALHLQVKGVQKTNANNYEKALQGLNDFHSKYVRNLETNRIDQHNMIINTANENNEQINTKYRPWLEQNRPDLMPQLKKMQDQEILENNKNAELAKAKVDARAAQLISEADKERKRKLIVLENHQARNKSEVEKFTTKTLKKRQFLHEYIVQNVMNNHKEKYLKLEQKILCGKNVKKLKEDQEIHQHEGFEKEDDECILRQTKRISILSKAYIPTYITVDIHNEGLDIICLKGTLSTNESLNSKENRKFSTDFIPWGYIARNFLYSIMCGEVPDHKIIDHEFLFSNGSQGLVKCIVTDKRVSPGDASDQRLKAMHSQSSRDTDQAAAEMNEKLSKHVNDETQAMEDMKRSSMLLEALKRKVAVSLKCDLYRIATLKHTFNPNISDQPLQKECLYGKLDEDKKQKVQEYISKANENIVNAEKDILFKTERLALLRKQRIGKAEAIKKILAETHYRNKINAKKEAMQEYHGSDVLCNFLLCFNQINGMGLRSNNSSKRVVLVLRCRRFLKKEAEFAIDKYNSTRDAQSQIEKNQVSLIRAEELLLMSLHPYLDEQLPSYPPRSAPSKSYEETWAEPGRYLDLTVPSLSHTSSSSLFGSEPARNVFDQHLSEMCSSSGRQFAASVSSHHMRVLQDDVNFSNDSDTLSLSEDKLKESYEFFMPPPGSRSRNSKNRRSGMSPTVQNRSNPP